MRIWLTVVGVALHLAAALAAVFTLDALTIAATAAGETTAAVWFLATIASLGLGALCLAARHAVPVTSQVPPRQSRRAISIPRPEREG